jgi:RimJ/RimL family protein N-acetyltransferase
MLHAYETQADAFTSTMAERIDEPEGWWLQRIHHPQGLSHCWGAFGGDVLVGTVTIEYSKKLKTLHKANVIGMYVGEQHRQIGFGRVLIQEVIQHARERKHVSWITLTVTEGNAAAQRLYERAGFQPFGLEPMAVFTGAGYKAKVHMGLNLNAPKIN